MTDEEFQKGYKAANPHLFQESNTPKASYLVIEIGHKDDPTHGNLSNQEIMDEHNKIYLKHNKVLFGPPCGPLPPRVWNLISNRSDVKSGIGLNLLLVRKKKDEYETLHTLIFSCSDIIDNNRHLLPTYYANLSSEIVVMFNIGEMSHTPKNIIEKFQGYMEMALKRQLFYV